MNQTRNVGLDYMRSLAITLVVLSHLTYVFKPSQYLQLLSLQLGYWGVELFFSLSGFLIGLQLLNPLVNYDGKFIKQFWMRRWFRTLPNYYVFLLVHIYIAGILFERCERYFVFAQSFTTVHPKLFMQAWSLCVEEFSYMVIPVFLLLFSFLKAPKINQNFIAIMLFITMAIVIKYSWHQHDIGWWKHDPVSVKAILIYRLDAAAYGILIALMKIHYKTFFDKNYKLFGLFGLLLILSCAFWINHLDKFEASTITLFTASAIATTCLIPLFYHIAPKNKLFNALILKISLSSCTIYLAHFIIRKIVFWQYSQNFLSGLGRTLCYLIILLYFSYVWYITFEKFFLKIGYKIFPQHHKIRNPVLEL
jgi:peptidoglycan/LPS O-acetylase OafA/YrhL